MKKYELNDLLALGAKVVGKIAKNGSSCLVTDIGQGGKLYTSLDKNKKILGFLKKIKKPNSVELTRFDANGNKIIESTHELYIKDGVLYGTNKTKRFIPIGPKDNTLEVEVANKTTEFYASTNSPFFEVATKEIKAGNSECTGTFRKTNLLTREKVIGNIKTFTTSYSPLEYMNRYKDRISWQKI